MRKVAGLLLLVAVLLTGVPAVPLVGSVRDTGRPQPAGHGGGELL